MPQSVAIYRLRAYMTPTPRDLFRCLSWEIRRIIWESDVISMRYSFIGYLNQRRLGPKCLSVALMLIFRWSMFGSSPMCRRKLNCRTKELKGLMSGSCLYCSDSRSQKMLSFIQASWWMCILTNNNSDCKELDNSSPRERPSKVSPMLKDRLTVLVWNIASVTRMRIWGVM